MPCNDDGGVAVPIEGNLSIFTYLGQSYGTAKPRPIEGGELWADQTYILFSCDEVTPYIEYVFFNISKIIDFCILMVLFFYLKYLHSQAVRTRSKN